MNDLIELMAVIASAIFGVLLARRHHMDFVGVFSLAFIVAFGGGTLRDLFLDRHPLFWIREQQYPVIVFAIALFTSLLPRIPSWIERYLNVPDALGLGLFSIVGAAAAIESGTSYFVAALMGAVTGTFGGVMGDIICNRVPSLFRPAPLVATCSFVGCWIYFAFNALPSTAPYSAALGIAFIVTTRLLAIAYNLTLPQLATDDVSIDTPDKS